MLRGIPPWNFSRIFSDLKVDESSRNRLQSHAWTCNQSTGRLVESRLIRLAGGLPPRKSRSGGVTWRQDSYSNFTAVRHSGPTVSCIICTASDGDFHAVCLSGLQRPFGRVETTRERSCCGVNIEIVARGSSRSPWVDIVVGSCIMICDQLGPKMVSDPTRTRP